MAKAKTPKTELAVIDKPEVQDLINKSGIVKTEAQTIAAKFMPFMQTVNDLSVQIEELKALELTPEIASKARRLRLDLVKNRGKDGLLTLHKSEKEETLIKGRYVDGLKNVIEASSELAELDAEKMEKAQERAEAERLATLKAERYELIKVYEPAGLIYMPLDTFTEEQFQKELSAAKETFEAVKIAREQAEAKRAEDEKAAEVARLEAIELEKKRIEDLRIENERLQAWDKVKAKRFNEMRLYVNLIRDFNGMQNMEEEAYQKELA